MNTNLSRHYQFMSPVDNLDKTDGKRRKLEEVHQTSSSYANKKYDVQLFKKNGANFIQNENSPNFNGSDVLGK